MCLNVLAALYATVERVVYFFPVSKSLGPDFFDIPFFVGNAFNQKDLTVNNIDKYSIRDSSKIKCVIDTPSSIFDSCDCFFLSLGHVHLKTHCLSDFTCP